MINVLIIDGRRNGRGAESPIRSTNPRLSMLWNSLDAGEAKEIIFNSDTPIDLILLDIYMQKENGLDLLPVLHNARCKVM